MTIRRLSEQTTQLLRIHKGTLINPAYIQQIVPKPINYRLSGEIMMWDGHLLSVARRRWQVLRELINEEATR